MLTSNSLISHLPTPLDTIVIEQRAGEYKDFELPENSTYPLRGVTYPVDYGYIPGYTGEDNAELDFFVGSNRDGICGTILVWRGGDRPQEHKFFVCLTDDELSAIKTEFAPVLREYRLLEGLEEVILEIEKYKGQAHE